MLLDSNALYDSLIADIQQGELTMERISLCYQRVIRFGDLLPRGYLLILVSTFGFFYPDFLGSRLEFDSKLPFYDQLNRRYIVRHKVSAGLGAPCKFGIVGSKHRPAILFCNVRTALLRLLEACWVRFVCDIELTAGNLMQVAVEFGEIARIEPRTIEPKVSKRRTTIQEPRGFSRPLQFFEGGTVTHVELLELRTTAQVEYREVRILSDLQVF